MFRSRTELRPLAEGGGQVGLDPGSSGMAVMERSSSFGAGRAGASSNSQPSHGGGCSLWDAGNKVAAGALDARENLTPSRIISMSPAAPVTLALGLQGG